MKVKFILLSIFILSSLAIVDKVSADVHIFKPEVRAILAYSAMENLYTYDTIGFEYFGVLSTDEGDWLQMSLQMRFAYNSLFSRSDNPNKYGNFTTFDDYKKIIQIHNFWFQFKLNSSIYLQIGQFDIPYGIEPQIDTHSSLLQLLGYSDLGMNKDWGININGALPLFDYRIGVTFGRHGLDILDYRDSYLITAEINTPVEESFYTLSLLYGKIPIGMDMSNPHSFMIMSNTNIERGRIILGLQQAISEFTIRAEYAFGFNNSSLMMGLLVEPSYNPAWANKWVFSLQYQALIDDLNMVSQTNHFIEADITFKPTTYLTFTLNYHYDFHKMLMGSDHLVRFMFYYFG